MKIGILSDTHQKLKKAKASLEMLLDEGAEFIIHAGDIVEVEMLEMLKNSNTRYVAVFGNNDAHLLKYQNNYNLVKEPHYFKLCNTTFKLMHMPYYMTGDTEVVVFGHTHTFFAQMDGGSLFINPGEVCARKKPISECAMLEVESDEFVLTHYTRQKGAKKFSSATSFYKRDMLR